MTVDEWIENEEYPMLTDFERSLIKKAYKAGQDDLQPKTERLESKIKEIKEDVIKYFSNEYNILVGALIRKWEV